MKRSTLHLGAASLMLFGLVAAAQGQKAPDNTNDFDRLVIDLALKAKAQLAAGIGTCTIPTLDPPLPDGTACIKLSKFDYNGRPYCLAEAPNLFVTDTATKIKKMHWWLDKTNLGTTSTPKPVEFHAEAGIVIMNDAGQNLIDKNHRGRGKDGEPDDKRIFHLRTKMKSDPVIVGYLPVIVWDPTNLGNWEVCAAIDPKIVNVP